MMFKKVLIAGVVGAVVNAVYSILICGQLIIPHVKRVTPSDFWIPQTGIHTLIMIMFGFVVCILWAFGYALLYKGIPGIGISKGVIYGCLLWLLGILPNNLALQLHTNIWPEFNWIFLSLSSLIRWVILGMIYALLYKVKLNKWITFSDSDIKFGDGKTKLHLKYSKTIDILAIYTIKI